MAIKLLKVENANNLYRIYMGAAKFESVGHFTPKDGFDVNRLGAVVETEEEALSGIKIKEDTDG